LRIGKQIARAFKIEKIVENRERICRQKIRQLESQCQLLREQLEAERRRSRDFRDRQQLDVGRPLGSGRLGGGFNSVGSYWPPIRNDNIDSIGYRFTKGDEIEYANLFVFFVMLEML
jgi:hypothetical protein